MRFVDELRTLVQKALPAIRAKQVDEAEKEKLRAQKIILHLASAAKKAASKGHTSVRVMEIKPEDHGRNEGLHIAPESMWGAASIVWDYCEREGLNPRIFRWWSISGDYGGVDLVIHWGDKIPDYQDEAFIY